MAKRPVDIEVLLQWALNEELPKGQHVMKPVWLSVQQYAEGKRGASFSAPPLQKIAGGFVPGEPHADARRIAAALARYDVVMGLSDRAALRGLLADLLPVDPSTIKGAPEPCMTAAMAVTPNIAGLLQACAILRRPPVERFAQPRCEPARRTRAGLPIVLREGADGNLFERKMGFSGDFAGEPRVPLAWLGVEKAAEQRAEYAIWLGALAMLARDLAGKLESVEALPSRRPPRPWVSAPPRFGVRSRAVGREMAAA